MTSASKVRVAIPDASFALEVATARVRAATGLRAEPEFQEIDRGDLIVELRLPEVGECPPRQLADLVERSSPDLEVLSAWREPVAHVKPRPSLAGRVMSVDDTALPEVARRAFDDYLPTATWRPVADGDVAHWQLAVPVVVSGCHVLAIVLRRNGYSFRFSALEAHVLGAALASAPRQHPPP
jgi:hypothetical protein